MKGNVMAGINEWPRRFLRVTASGSYNPQIDGLRFLALVPILFWHSWLRAWRGWNQGHVAQPFDHTVAEWVPSGYPGVLLFFFVSGYVIAWPFLKGRAPPLGAFFARRIKRLAPPYILVLTISLAIVSVVAMPKDAATFHANSGATNFESYLASLFYMHGLIYHYNPRLLPPAWTLEIEFQFYLVAPFLLAAYNRVNSFAARVWLIAACVAALIVTVNLMAESLGDRGLQRWLLIGHLYPFLLGFLMCDYADRTRLFEQSRKTIFDVAFFAGLLGLAWTGFYFEKPVPLDIRLVRDVASVPLLLLVLLGAARGSIGHALLGNPWVTLIGGACYSIYLVHVPLMYPIFGILSRVVRPDSLILQAAITFAVLIPACIAAGLCYYLAIERPCMAHDWPTRLWRRITGARAAPAATG